MSILLQICRYNLANEASTPNKRLRVLVGHANMIDDIIDGNKRYAAQEENYWRYSAAAKKNERSSV
jgi:hypothetical protein